MDGQSLRRVVLEVVSEFSKMGASFQSAGVMEEAARRLGIKLGDVAEQQSLLTFWGDLFRTGYLSWGYNLANSAPPFCHLTEQGRKALAHVSRDPANPAGYLEYLSSRAFLSPIAQSYIEEALKTFNSYCFKASAVMIGVATEAMVLEIRDVLCAKLNTLGQTKPADLTDWRAKKILDAIEQILTPKSCDMPKELKESFESYWPAFTQQIRTIRNDAGHPKSVEPVQEEVVHSALLIFPELASLGSKLTAWIRESYR